MSKSRIGPFALESPLAPPTKAGQMFRGIHIEQRKLAAIRVFSIPMGMTPESRQAYADQLELLKSLRHRGIVRCYGGGFDARHAFLAYELIDGDSLEAVLERRGRLSWETTLEYAKQIGEALQYTQQFAWTHGRLQPSKILINGEGVIKISDWRHDAISAMLDSPMNLQQMQMMAPELLDGQSPTEKSDLYSVGALMYWMLTGSPPFAATDPATLTYQIRQTPAPSVAASAMDCPVWMNAIVDQLLAKDPAQRPFGIAAFQLALREAERREAEGVGVLQHATAGFSALKMNVDRSEAEKLLGIKHKKEKTESENSWWESIWVLALGLVFAIGAIVWFLLPPSEASLYKNAQRYLASDKWNDWNDARDQYLQPLLERFPEGQYAEWATEKVGWVNARETERRMDREERLGRRSGWSPAQIQYAEAREFERFGDFASALDKFKAIQTLFADQEESQPIIFLASESIARIQQSGKAGNLETLLTKKMEQADQAYERAQISAAQEIWQSIVELYSNNQQVAPIVEQASIKLDEASPRKK